MYDEQVRVGVARGCLAGLALSIAFLVAGVLIFFIARSSRLNEPTSLVLGIAGGPVITTVIVLGAFVLRSRERNAASNLQDDQYDNETTAGNGS